MRQSNTHGRSLAPKAWSCEYGLSRKGQWCKPCSTHIGSWQCRSNAPRRSSAYLVLRAARAPTCCQVPLTAALPYSAPSLDERVMRQMVSLRCIPFFRDLRRRSPPAAQGLTAVGVTTRRSLPTAFCRCSFRRSVIWWWLASTRGFSVCGALVGCRVHQLRWAGKQTEQAPALWHGAVVEHISSLARKTGFASIGNTLRTTVARGVSPPVALSVLRLRALHRMLKSWLWRVLVMTRRCTRSAASATEVSSESVRLRELWTT
mmetsp:Transcript_23763/g.72660  ORF Transcript_23763/g.72660 Transcript_23763/m.72660 type:complete len:261 (+) Transcript_23763:1540-2322(+)